MENIYGVSVIIDGMLYLPASSETEAIRKAQKIPVCAKYFRAGSWNGVDLEGHAELVQDPKLRRSIAARLKKAERVKVSESLVGRFMGAVLGKTGITPGSRRKRVSACEKPM